VGVVEAACAYAERGKERERERGRERRERGERERERMHMRVRLYACKRACVPTPSGGELEHVAAGADHAMLILQDVTRQCSPRIASCLGDTGSTNCKACRRCRKHPRVHCNTRHTAHCNTLQHTATHCNTLQHTVRSSFFLIMRLRVCIQASTSYCVTGRPPSILSISLATVSRSGRSVASISYTCVSYDSFIHAT